MLTINQLELSYTHKTILNNINIRVNEGESLAIIGPSGCGKTTLLLCIAGILSYDKGEILLDQKPINLVQRQIGLALQEYNLFPWYTVYKNLSLGLKARGYKKTEIRERIMTIAEKLRITHLLKRYPIGLSGGERQRVAIGCILILEPRLLLLDEPSSALDALHKEKFQDFILELQQEHHMTMLFVTHNIEEAIVLGKNILIMLPDGSYTIYPNELYGQKDVRQHLDFYTKCLELKGYLKLEGERDEP